MMQTCMKVGSGGLMTFLSLDSFQFNDVANDAWY